MTHPTSDAPRSRLWRRAVALVAAGLALHVVAPGLIALAGALPQLRRIRPQWFLLMAAAELGSLGGAWALMRVATPGLGWRTAAASQLAGNAVSRVLPGGAAVGSAVTYRIWARSGVLPGPAASGLVVTSIVSTLTLLALPASALLVATLGAPVPRGLLILALGVLGLAVALSGFAALLLFNDNAAELAHRGIARVVRLFSRRDAAAGSVTTWLSERHEMRTLLGNRWRVALGASVANWGLDIAALVLALTAVGSRPHVSLVVLAYVTGAVLGMIPITPGGLGFVEAGLLGSLALAGVPTSDALIAVLAYRVVSYWLPIVIGLGFYGRLRSRHGFSEVDHQPASGA